MGSSNQIPLKKPRTNKWLKRTLFILILICLLFSISLTIAAGMFRYVYLYQFEQAAGVPLSQIVQTVQRGWSQTPLQTDQKKNILILGVDEVANRTGDPLLTDTMMLLSLDLETGYLGALSLPRDLWSTDYQTKINALYVYGQDRYPDEPERFTKEVVESLTGVPIHHTVVLSMNTLSEIIDGLGGIEVNVEQGFKDEQFPRLDVDVRTERDPAKLYQTIEFHSGVQLMNAERALQYIRSRKSDNPTAGSDDARANRQQQVLSAILAKLRDRELLAQPKTLGKMYALYTQSFSHTLPMEEVVAVANTLHSQVFMIEFDPQSLSVENEVGSGVLIHPPVSKYNQWVYEIKDDELFQMEVKNKLGIVI